MPTISTEHNGNSTPFFPIPWTVFSHLHSMGEDPDKTKHKVWWNEGSIMDKDPVAISREITQVLREGRFSLTHLDDGYMLLIVTAMDIVHSHRKPEHVDALFKRLDIVCL